METLPSWFYMNVSFQLNETDGFPTYSSAVDLTDKRRQCFVVHVFTDTIRILIYFLAQAAATCSNFRINFEIYSSNLNFAKRRRINSLVEKFEYKNLNNSIRSVRIL